MKKNNFIISLNLKPLILILGALGMLFSSEPEISEGTFLFCLKSNVEPFEIVRSELGVSISHQELNDYFFSRGVVDIEKWIPQATEMDYDGDIYLNRIYRVYISDENRHELSSIVFDVDSFRDVEYAENEFIRRVKYTPNDPLANQQCSLNSVKATQAWDFWDIPNGLIPDGQQVLLASVDTGVDYTHPDIQSNSWINQAEIPEWLSEAGLDQNDDGYYDASEIVLWLQNEGMDVDGDGFYTLRDIVSTGSPFEDGDDNDGNGYADDLLGWDTSGAAGIDDNDPYPKEEAVSSGTWAHGTHVAGILAATSDNNLGMASTSYNAKFISVKASRDNQSGEPGINDGYPAILYAAKAGYYAGTFTIINNSWGGGGYSGSENATINTAFNTYGAVVVCAAGNGDDAGGQAYESHYPSSYDNSVSVCAMGCSYSWGNWATYHPTVDLAAPGENIHSTIIGTGYEAWDGSSMASPNAASCFGLLKAYYPDWSNQELMDRIYSTADRIVYDQNPDYLDCNGNSGQDCFGHGMVDVYKAIGLTFSPNISIENSSVNMVNDDDGVLNPGETAQLSITLNNEQGWTDANALFATLSTENQDVNILNDFVQYGSLAGGESFAPSDNFFEFQVSEDIELGDILFTLNLGAVGNDSYVYTDILNLDVLVSLFQSGFPYDTESEIRSAPIILDLNNDGDNEIVFADYSGKVRLVDDGQEVDNSIFPYDTGDQIWGGIASADIDNDGMQDFVVASKSQYIYIFDINGLKASYNAGKYLIGTPAIANIDADEDLEVVIGSYGSPTSSNLLYVINHDGTDVPGFPLLIGEKIKAGVAIADMDQNGLDDIIFGTDSKNLYVVLDNGTVSSNFPIELGDKLQGDPAIYITGLDERIILLGCKDENFYGINYSDASLRFLVPTGDDIFTSPSFHNNNIYFGSDDGNVYAIDANGNMLNGFPIDAESPVSGSIVFSDVNGDGAYNMLFGTESGKIYAFDENQQLLNYFPIIYQYGISSSVQIVDFDNDGDAELAAGSHGDIVLIDMKFNNFSSDGYWSLFKGDYNRKALYVSVDNSGCGNPVLGDVNCSGVIDILDIIEVVNIIILGSSDSTDYELWSADIIQDGIIDILDIISIVNIVMDN